MLSAGAVNAFLKTLEEPPNNVIFILATTDPQKLPITILSRCQRFDFKRINNNEITARLRKIVDDQNVLADERSLNLIARVSDGAMRDSLSILDQAISMGNGNVDYIKLLKKLYDLELINKEEKIRYLAHYNYYDEVIELLEEENNYFNLAKKYGSVNTRLNFHKYEIMKNLEKKLKLKNKLDSKVKI